MVGLTLAGAVVARGATVPAVPQSVFGGAVNCSTQPGGIVFCGSLIVDNQPSPGPTLATSFDGTAIDVNFAMPTPTASHHPPYPVVLLLTGDDGFKYDIGTQGGGLASQFLSMLPWLKDGYATFSMTYRGFNQSCGTAAIRASLPAAECANGFNHILDTRYEVRDAQYFAGELVDQGLVSPTKIAAFGGSYGAAASVDLAALKNRVMLANGALIPWRSPDGTPMSLAAAAPFAPWTDLAYSMVPNGSTLDYVADAPYRGRYGVEKSTYDGALYIAGCGNPTTNCTTTNFAWNFGAWLTRLNAGEPYLGSLPASILQQLEDYHSAYYINHSEPPAPLMIASGFTDPLFPADEALRYYNRTTTQYPTAPISLFLGDWGHVPGQFKQADMTRFVAAAHSWIDYYLSGTGPKPFQGVQALTETCPATAPSAGPYRASSWARLQPGEVRLTSPKAQTIRPTAGSAAIGNAFNPLTAKACTTAPGATEPGTATYLLKVKHAFTMMGSATVIADFTLPGANSQVAARLLDVSGGQETLISRGLWRPAVSTKPVRQVFQLHPGAWRFASGHTLKLELLPDDMPYGAASKGQRPVTIANLQLRIPTLDRPGAAGGLVAQPLPKFLPPGYQLAREFAHP
jgi:predicted acyl esterase